MSFQESDSHDAPEEIQDPQVEESDAPTVDGGTGDAEDFLSSFNINDVPDEYREHVERYYNQAKGDYTRKTQELAEQRKQYEGHQDELAFLESLQSDPDVQLDLLRRLAEAHGYELEDFEENVDESELDDGEPAFEDPRLTALLEEMEQERQHKEYEDFIEGVAQYMAEQLREAEKQLGRPLDEDERDLVEAYALSQAQDDGKPNVKKAIDHIRKLEASWQSRWIESKANAAQAPHGIPGSERIDLSDKHAREDHMARIVQSHMLDNNNT